MSEQNPKPRRLAAFGAQMKLGSMPALLFMSIAAYLTLAIFSQWGVLTAHDGSPVADSSRIPHSASQSLDMLAVEWGLMVVGMMTPLAALQVSHIYQSTVRGVRIICVAAFLCAFWLTWFVAMLVLFPVASWLSSVFGDVGDSGVALALAIVLSASPMAQRARNRCHRIRTMSPFGARAMMGCSNQGIGTATSCVVACWPWMLVPLTVQSWHLLLMILFGAYMFVDRIAPAAPPRWRLPPAFETLFGSGPSSVRCRSNSR